MDKQFCLLMDKQFCLSIMLGECASEKNNVCPIPEMMNK